MKSLTWAISYSRGAFSRGWDSGSGPVGSGGRGSLAAVDCISSSAGCLSLVELQVVTPKPLIVFGLLYEGGRS